MAAKVALERHRRQQQEERARAGEMLQEHGLVFTTPIGRPLDSTNVTGALQRRLVRAGLRRQRFHDLRHACASLLLSRGVSPRVVTEMLGHSQISLTMDTYSHVLPSLLSDGRPRWTTCCGTINPCPALPPRRSGWPRFHRRSAMPTRRSCWRRPRSAGKWLKCGTRRLEQGTQPRWSTMTGTVAASDAGHPATDTRAADHVRGRGWVCTAH